MALNGFTPLLIASVLALLCSTSKCDIKSSSHDYTNLIKRYIDGLDSVKSLSYKMRIADGINNPYVSEYIVKEKDDRIFFERRVGLPSHSSNKLSKTVTFDGSREFLFRPLTGILYVSLTKRDIPAEYANIFSPLEFLFDSEERCFLMLTHIKNLNKGVISPKVTADVLRKNGILEVTFDKIRGHDFGLSDYYFTPKVYFDTNSDYPFRKIEFYEVDTDSKQPYAHSTVESAGTSSDNCNTKFEFPQKIVMESFLPDGEVASRIVVTFCDVTIKELPDETFKLDPSIATTIHDLDSDSVFSTRE